MEEKQHLLLSKSNVIGLDMGGTKMQSGFVKHGQLTQIHKRATRADGSEDDVLHDLFQLLDNYQIEDIDGIGIGIPSIVDVEHGIVYDVSNIPSWKEVHLKKVLEERYSVPVFLNNDANVFTLGEKYFGCAQQYSNVAGVTLGTGMGTGLIINHKLYNGNNCGAGEFGMMPYKDGILENYSSGQFFKNQIGLPGDRLFKDAEQGEPGALDAFDRFGFYVGEAVKMIMYAVDPNLIVLGGSVSKAYPYFKKAMFRQLETICFTNVLDRIKIEVSTTKNVALLGAAALCYEHQEINKKT